MLMRIEHLELDTQSGQLTKHHSKEESSQLDHTPLQLLLCLIHNKGENVTKKTMLEEVWPGKVVSEDVLSVAISQIRKALGDNARKPKFVKTIPGVGYRFIAEINEINNTTEIDSPTIDAPPLAQKRHIKSQWKLAICLTFVFSLIFFQLRNTQAGLVSVEQLASADVIEKYQKGRYLLTADKTEDWQKAIKLFQETIISEPNFAPVYRELVEAKLKLIEHNPIVAQNNLDEYYSLLNKSLALNPSDAKTYRLLADITFYFGWNFELAKHYYQQALTLTPDEADLHFVFGNFLLAKGEFSSSLKHLKKYIELNPQGYAISSITWAYNMLGDHSSALAQLSRLEQLEPESFAFYVSKQVLMENMGNDAEAYDAMYKLLEMSHYSVQQLADVELAHNTGGLSAVYSWLLDVKKETAYLGQYVPPLSFARYAISSGQYERAVGYVLQAYEKRQTELLWFNIDPRYQPIRNHPKLKKLFDEG